jgi:hypothetical protein
MRLTVSLVQPVVPPGWSFQQSTTLFAPHGDASIIASSEPLDPSMDTERYAAVQLGLLQREMGDFLELASGRLLLGDAVPARWRQFRWTPPDGVSVTQLQVYAAAGGRGATATATTPSTEWDRYESLVHDVMRSMHVAVDRP